KHLLRRAVSPLLPRDIGKREKQPYRAPLLRPFLGPAAPEWVTELLDAASVTTNGLFSAGRVTGLAAKARKNLDRGVSEMDEMALMGVLSTLLLDHTLGSNPQAAAPAEPAVVVDLQVGAA
ncbi:MAG TPA: asparagine synthase-related protein, partial [Deinococcales bacterium]|nr:asparagine synthase-related protein [Deinococcales bacterium]